MPRAKNYKIGSYWSGSSEDTVRFIKDRIKWARDVNLKRIAAARKYLKLLKKWDFKEETKLKAAELRDNFLLW